MQLISSFLLTLFAVAAATPLQGKKDIDVPHDPPYGPWEKLDCPPGAKCRCVTDPLGWLID